MTPTSQRIGIVASIVGALGAVVYLMRGKDAPIIVPGLSGGAGYANFPGVMSPVSVAGEPGAAGPPGAAGIQGATGAAGIPGATGAAGVPMTATDAITGFVNTYNPPPTGPYATPSTFFSALPPWDNFPYAYMKAYQGNAANPAAKESGGCGCKGKKSACGGSGSGCPNAPPPVVFTDGKGACMSSTPGTLAASIENCAPNFTDAMLLNIQGNLTYMGSEKSPNLETINTGIGSLRRFLPTEEALRTLPYRVPSTTFGAS